MVDALIKKVQQTGGARRLVCEETMGACPKGVKHMTEHKPHTGFKIAASVLHFFGVAAASLAIVIHKLLLSSL